MLTPLRDEISVQIGTSMLSMLFVASVAVNVLAQGAAAHLLAPARTDRGVAISRLFMFVAAVLLIFAAAFSLSGPAVSGTLADPAYRSLRHLLQQASEQAGAQH